LISEYNTTSLLLKNSIQLLQGLINDDENAYSEPRSHQRHIIILYSATSKEDLFKALRNLFPASDDLRIFCTNCHLYFFLAHSRHWEAIEVYTVEQELFITPICGESSCRRGESWVRRRRNFRRVKLTAAQVVSCELFL
jgi:hypothetical protein